MHRKYLSPDNPGGEQRDGEADRGQQRGVAALRRPLCPCQAGRERGRQKHQELAEEWAGMFR